VKQRSPHQVLVRLSISGFNLQVFDRMQYDRIKQMKIQITALGRKAGLIFNLGAFLFLLQTVSCKHDPVTPDPLPRSMEVWLHHVNTTDKARHFQNAYSGFELDVHYDLSAGTFIVKHDFTDTTSLTLSTWLSAITDPGRLGFWLDFKNLLPENQAAALAELLRIRNQFGLIHHPVVVESYQPDWLPPFDTLNFRVSYYIPTFNPATITEAEELEYREIIQGVALKDGIGTISGYSFQHGFMQKWFPDMNKLLWCLDVYDPAIKDTITEIRKDPTIEVLLVSETYPLSNYTGHSSLNSEIEK
jgi:hypothetical protein